MAKRVALVDSERIIVHNKIALIFSIYQPLLMTEKNDEKIVVTAEKMRIFVIGYPTITIHIAKVFFANLVENLDNFQTQRFGL